MAEKKKVILEAEVKAALTGAKEVTDKIQKFKDQMDSIEIPKDVGKNLEKTLDKVLKDIGAFEVLASKGVVSMSDTKELERAWKTILRELNTVEATFKGLNGSNIFPKEVTDNITRAQGALTKYLDKLNKAKESAAYKSKSEGRDKAAIEEQAKQSALEKAIKKKAAAELEYQNKSGQWSKEKQAEYDKELKKIAKLKKQKENYLESTKKKEKQQLTEQLRMEGYLAGDEKKGYRISGRKITSTNAIKDADEKAAAQERIRLAQETLEELQRIKNVEADLEAPIKEHEGTAKNLESIRDEAIAAEKDFKNAAAEVASYEAQVTQAKQETAKLDAELEDMAANDAKQEWQALVAVIREFTGVDLSQSAQDIELVQQALENYKAGEMEKLPQLFELLKERMLEIPGAAGHVTGVLDDVGNGMKEFTRAEQDLENLKNSFLGFFSLTNSVELFKRAIRSAVETVKELDKVMTETAVVTEYSIEDMWDKLPQYAEQASKLGTSISDLYSATTLYYQQGLKTEQAMGVGVETMKMARIAGMDATDATTAMTAALRGFNMAVDEMNAQKVNDVYSELAAITAADTNQIATAMGKTASIAASANMEFETTAAFLAQIIETTQEAPETAGTALKTIIARFTEVKELFDEGMLTGKDSEGEEININKIDEALRTVGISLKDFLNGSKGMDEIFLELASKWDGLDLATQRYIATAAAGSRQQSRFIAMMSNYGRTVELVNAANNSAGAGQEQFNKTLESLEAKLQKLENAWNTFIMGLANDEAIKVVVDGLTLLLNVLNKIIDIISGENGAIKSITSLGLAFGALKVGGGVFEAAFSTFGQAAASAGKDASFDFSKSFSANLKTQFGKTGDFFKVLFPKRGIKKGIKSSGLSAILENVDLSKLSNNVKIDLKNSLWADADKSLHNSGYEQETINQVKKNFEDAFSSNGAEAGIKKLQQNLTDLKVEFETSGKTAKIATQEMEDGLGGAALATAGVAAGLNIVTSLLSNMGHERGAEGFEALASGASIAATALSVLPGLLAKIGASTAAVPWVAALIGVISLGVAISKWVETGEEKLERLNKEAQEAADAANEAKQAYEGLLSKESEYSGLQKELEDLTKGTDEWKQKLVEVNNEVLSLLDTYPELVSYIKRGDEGQLVIEEKGWDAVLESRQKIMNASQRLSMASRAAALDQEISLIKEDTANIVGESSLGQNRMRESALHGTSTKTISIEDFRKLIETEDVRDQELAELYFNYSDLLKDGNTYQTLKSNGMMDSVLDRAEQLEIELPKTIEAELLKQQNKIDAKSLQKASYYKTFLNTLGAGSNEDSQLRELVAEGFSQNMGRSYEKVLAEIEKTYYHNYQQLVSDYEEAFGTGSSAGMSKEAMRANLTKNKMLENEESEFESLIKGLNKIKDKDTKNEYAVLLSLSTGQITAGMAGLEDEDDLSAMLSAMGFTTPEQQKEFAKMYGIEGEGWQSLLKDKFNEILTTGQEEITDKIQEAYEMGVRASGLEKDTDGTYTTDGHLVDATNEQNAAYLDFAVYLTGALGASGSLGVTNTLDKILNGASAENQQKIYDYIAAADFQAEGAGEDFVEFLKELGVITPAVEGKMGDFTTDLNRLSKGFERIDLSKVINNVKELLDLSDDFSEREESQGLTQEEYDKIIAANIKNVGTTDFFWTGQEWSYLGGSMEDLAEAIRENTGAILEEDMATIKQQIGRGENAEEWAFRATRMGISEDDFLAGTVTDYTILQRLFQTDTKAEAQWQYQQLIHAWQNLIPNLERWAEYEKKGGTIERFMTDTAVLGANQDVETLKAQADSYNISEEAIKAYEKALGTAGVTGEKATRRATELAIQHAKLQKSIDDSSDSLKDYAEILKTADENSLEYKTAMSEAVGAVNKIFGTKLDFESVDENFADLLGSWMDGSEDAFVKIREMFGASLKGEIESLGLEFAEVEALIASLDFSATGTVVLEDGQLKKSLAVAENGVNSLLSALMALGGVSVTFEKGEGEDDNYYINTLTKMDNFIPTGSRSSGGGGSSKWENPYDKFYNTVRRINNELRVRERLERQYQRLLDKSVVSSDQLAQNAREQIASLEYEKKTREYLLKKRREEMALLGSEFSDVAHYASWDENVGVMLNQEALAKLDGSTNEKLTSKVEKYISKMEEKAEQIYEETNAIDEIEDTVKEIREQGKDEYIDFENQVKDALIFEREQEIEKLTEINETINDSNSKLISAMQESINKERQARENSKTEEELEEKRQRLAQLQMDTSGANALEILALEKEIAEQEQGYIDTLVDQKIQALQDQNEKAYEQRQHQIEILQWQKEFWEKSGDIWKDVQSIFTDGFDSVTNQIKPGSKLETLLKAYSEFDSKSQEAQQEWLKELNQTLTAALGYLEVSQQLEDIGVKAGTEIDFIHKGQVHRGIVNEDGSVTTADGTVYNNVYKGLGGYYAGENVKEEQKQVIEEPSFKTEKAENVGSNGYYDNQGYDRQEIENIQKKLSALGYKVGEIDGLYGERTKKAVIEFKKSRNMPETSAQLTDYFLEKLSQAYKYSLISPAKGTGGGRIGVTQHAFKTGGLADFTGPAWLDGTKAKPEYVLDAAQTERFFTLVDILDSWKGMDKTKNNQNNGDNIVDIDINIETVKEEADVDMLAEKVQHAIITSARYRNNSFVQR